MAATFDDILNGLLLKNREAIAPDSDARKTFEKAKTDDPNVLALHKAIPYELNSSRKGRRAMLAELWQYANMAILAGYELDADTTSALKGATNFGAYAKDLQGEMDRLRTLARNTAVESGVADTITPIGQSDKSADKIIQAGIQSGNLIKGAEQELGESLDSVNNIIPKLLELNMNEEAARLQLALEYIPKFAQAEFDAAKEFDPKFLKLTMDTAQGMIPQILQMQRESDPEGTKLGDALMKDVLGRMENPYALPEGLGREITQDIRGGQTARGITFGRAPITAEAITKGSFRENMATNTRNAANALLQTRAQTQADPLTMLFGRQVTRQTNTGQSLGTSPSSIFPMAFHETASLARTNFNNAQLNRLMADMNKDSKSGTDWGAIISGVISGAGTGASVGGPWGAVAGGILGGVAGAQKK